MDFLNLIAENGADFSKGFVIGAMIGFIAYYFWDKHKLKAMQIQVDAIKNSAEIQINTLKEHLEATKKGAELQINSLKEHLETTKKNAEIQINTLKEQVGNYKSLLEIEKQRHQTIEESFKEALILKVKGGI